MALWRKNLYTKIHLSSGYGKYMEKVLKNQKLFHRFNVFPNAVKEAFSFTTSADYYHVKNLMWGWRGPGLWQLLYFILLYLLKGQVPRLHQKIQRSSAWKPKDWGYSGTLGSTCHCWWHSCPRSWLLWMYHPKWPLRYRRP